MGLLRQLGNTLRTWLGGGTAAADSSPATTQTPAEPTTVRRWDASVTDRLNSAHWQNALGNPINLDLSSDLETLFARCDHEAYNNPIVEGVIRTYGIDLIGPTGPTLQVISDDSAYNSALRDVWAEWFEQPTADGQQSGLDWLSSGNWGLWTRGAILAQLVSMDTAAPVVSRILPIDARRLQTPWGSLSDPAVTLGVRRNTYGRPLAFNIVDVDHWGSIYQVAPNWIDAEDVIHAYEIQEPGQARGYPWLASGLQEIADLRDFDIQVMDASRAAASTGIYFYSTVPEACSEFRVVGGSTSMGRREERVVPPGYQPMQLTPGQPSAQYIDFRHEKLRAIGRPVHMPLLLVLLSAEESNFSQSRIDVNVFYERGLAVRRNWLRGTVLNPLVNMVAREAGLFKRRGRFVLPPRPDRVKYHWVWDPIPQADPEKFANYVTTALQWGWLTYEDVCSMFGRDTEQMIAIRKRINERLKSAGLPEIPGPEAKINAGNAGGASGIQTNQDQQNADQAGGSRRRRNEQQGATANV